MENLINSIEMKNRKSSPVSYAQESFWLAEQLYANSSAFNERWSLRIKGILNSELMIESLYSLLIRHKILRTNILMQNGELVQRVSDTLPSVKFLDLTKFSFFKQEEEIKNISKNIVNESFKLEADQLIRVVLIKMNEADHKILFCAHHSIIDGWSVGILIDELKQIYYSSLKGKPLELPKQTYDYQDFSIEQRNLLSESVIEKQITYWENKLEKVPKVISFPSDFIRPAVTSHKGDNLIVTLSEELTLQLEKLALKEKVTPFMLFLTAYSIVVARISEQEEFIIGTSTAGRKKTEFENTVGCFVNTLPLVVNTKDNPSIQSLLTQIRTNSLEAYENQDVPLEKLLNGLKVERDTSKTSLIQIMFAFLNFAESDIPNSELDFTYEDMPGNIAKFDLTLMLRKEKDVFKGSFEYSTDIFEKRTIERLFEQMKIVLKSMVTDIQQPVASISVMTENEKKLLEELNNNNKEVSYLTYIHQFKEAVEKYPKLKAIEFKESFWTYGELDERSDIIASNLLNNNLEPHCAIGVVMEKSPTLIAVILGIWKAGFVFVPIDSELPISRCEYVIKDSNIKLIVADSDHISKISMFEKKLEVEQLCKERKRIDIEFPKKEDPAYIIYTSGSTGQPKGVVISHKGLPNIAEVQKDVFEVAPEDKVLQIASFSFDSAISEMTLALSSGASLVMNNKYEMMPGEALANLIEEKNITHMILVPSSLSLLPKRAYKNLKTIAVAGEECPGSLVDIWAKDFKMLNLYGPTENTIWSTYSELLYKEGKRSSIGRPIANTEIYIVNNKDEIVPQGTPGELLIAGYGLADNYIGLEELTKSKFVHLDSLTNRLLYRSGDIVRMRNDGELEFLSRVDSQVKIRGHRVELGEIESILNAHHKVLQSAVIVDQDHNSDKRLIAFVAGNDKDLERELFEYLKNNLPVYMVPSLIIVLESLPYNISGKIDRALLVSNLDKVLSPLTLEKVESDQLESQLIIVFKEILGVSDIEVTDNFFELGGHSLTATRLTARIRAIYEVDVPLGKFFRTPTINGVKALINEAAPLLSKKIHEKSTIPVVTDDARTIPSSSQERMWFLNQLHPNSSAYNIPFKFHIEGELNLEALEKALNKVIERHEILNTRLVYDNEILKSVLEGDNYLNISTINLSHLNPLETQNALESISKTEAETPFSLNKSHLLRATIVKKSLDSYCLLLTFHHIVTDGWSISIFNRELKEFYRAEIENKIPDLSVLPIQYADYAVWHKELATNGTLDNQILFWESKLNHIPKVLDMPTDFKRPAVFTQRGAHIEHKLEKNTVEAIKTIRKETGINTFSILFTAFSKLLSKYADQNKFIIGTPVAGRRRKELEELIGLFVNTLPIPVDFSTDFSIEDTLKNVQGEFIEFLDNQDVPFESLVEKFEAERDLTRSSLFQTMFVLQNTPNESFELHDLKVEMEENNPESTKFDLTLYVWEELEDYQLLFSYAKDLYKKDSILKMISHFEEIIIFMSQNLKKPMKKVSMLTVEDEKIYKKLESEKNDWSAENFDVLLEKQIQKFRNNRAVESEEITWSYSDISKLSEEVELFLSKKELKPGSIVAIEVQNSPVVIPLILGIWKAGLAFVPIDTKLPEKRKAYMLEETNAAIHIKAKKNEFNEHFSMIDSLDINELVIRESTEDKDRAYIIYTSGSTGKPKGVEVTHRGIPNLAKAQADILCLTPTDRVLQYASLTFDAAISDLVMTLYSGATAIFIKKEDLQGDTLLDRIESKLVTVIKIPPSLLHFLPVRKIPTLRILVLGGEVITKKTLELAFSITDHIVDFYGVSEATGRSLYKEYDKKAVSSLGGPLPNTSVYILDSDLQKVPVGIEGDLYLGGIGLAKGYINQREQTKKQFYSNPFIKNPQEKIYKTGDRAKLNELGEVVFKGRKDNQIKVRSSRVELGEINSVLESFEEVAQSVVRAVSFGEMDVRIIGYVRSPESKQINVKELRLRLAEYLPEYMVPFSIIQIEKFSLTQNGKVDFSKLPLENTVKAEEISNIDYQDNDEDEVEEKIKEIWSTVLGIKQINVSDNFFDIGGNSLLLTRVHTLVKGITSKEISVLDLFANPTIKALANKLRNNVVIESTAPSIQIRDRRNLRSEQKRRRVNKEDSYE